MAAQLDVCCNSRRCMATDIEDAMGRAKSTSISRQAGAGGEAGGVEPCALFQWPCAGVSAGAISMPPPPVAPLVACADVGISEFAAGDVAGIGGRIKCYPEDFQVSLAVLSAPAACRAHSRPFGPSGQRGAAS